MMPLPLLSLMALVAAVLADFVVSCEKGWVGLLRILLLPLSTLLFPPLPLLNPLKGHGMTIQCCLWSQEVWVVVVVVVVVVVEQEGSR